MRAESIFFVLSLVVSFVSSQYNGTCSSQYLSPPYNGTVIVGSLQTAQISTTSGCFTKTAPFAWYSFSPSYSPGTVVTISTCNLLTNYDTILFVFGGSNCNQISCLT